MNITASLLYLLLFYAVLDKEGKLSLTTGMIIAFVVLLFNCYLGGNKSLTGGNVFCSLNNI